MYPTPESSPKAEEVFMPPRDGIGFTWTRMDTPLDAHLEKCSLYEGSFADIPGTFSPYVVGSFHNIKNRKRALSLLWANEIGMVYLCPSHAGEWLLIGQRSSTSQRAKRTDSSGQRADCLNGPPLVMWHCPCHKLPPTYQPVKIVSSPWFTPLENVMISDTLIKCQYYI